MLPEEARERLGALGFSREDAETLFRHFDDSERRGSLGHGHGRIEWLESLDGIDPDARPERIAAEPGLERWRSNGALGYLTLEAAVKAQLAHPPPGARLVVCEDAFPTGALGYWVRRLASAGLVAALTANSPPRLAHPSGGPRLVGTNPIAIAVPSSDGRPLVADVSMGRVTYGDVIRGAAREEELVPFGGDRAHKAFALAVGLEVFVRSLVRSGEYGAVLLVVRPEADPVPSLRARALGVRLPGDR